MSGYSLACTAAAGALQPFGDGRRPGSAVQQQNSKCPQPTIPY